VQEIPSGFGIIIVDTLLRGIFMKTRIQKWGNSLALRIPKSFAQEVGLNPDGMVELSLVNGQLIICPLSKAVTLDTLLEGITPENLHGEINTGEPVGQEIW
jgi:antitoxin MazE